jgi:mannitol-1-/sugar-/sorbitol-6-phosphatase
VTSVRTTESADLVTEPEPEPEAAPARVSAILFDLDGVLVDSLKVVERAWRRWAGEQKIPAEDVLAAVHGRTAREVIAEFAPHLDAAEQALLVSSYETQHRGDLAVVPGARECVALARQGRWAVVTSGTRTLATARLVVVGLPVPGIMITADDVTSGKPDPEPYRRAATALAVPAAECVVVEDAPMGVLAAKRAGMTVLAVATTHAVAALDRADLVFPGMHGVTGWLRARGRPVGLDDR